MKKYTVKRTLIVHDEVEVIASNRSEAATKAKAIDTASNFTDVSDIKVRIVDEKESRSIDELKGLVYVALHMAEDNDIGVKDFGPWIDKKAMDEKRAGYMVCAFLDEYGCISVEFGTNGETVEFDELCENKQIEVCEAVIESAGENGVNLPEHLDKVRVHWFDPARGNYASAKEYRRAYNKIWRVYKADSDMVGLSCNSGEAEVYWNEIRFIGLKK